MTRRNLKASQIFRNLAVLAMATAVFFATASTVHAQAKAEANEDFDQYKLRIDTSWYYSNPSGNIHGATDTGSVDLSKDLGFGSYSTFLGKVDWKFTRKNHLYVSLVPLDTSHSTVLSRTFVFEGKTFNAGLTANSTLNTLAVAPGYQYDFIRRKRGHLGLQLQLDIFDTKATINASGQVSSGEGTQQTTVSANGSLLTAIPVAGPEFRYYLTDSPKVFVDGFVDGMYLFGYGNFISAGGKLGVNLSKHFAVIAGYELGSHLVVNSASNRIGLRVTQKGATVGLQTSF
jgi:hypothetical protein